MTMSFLKLQFCFGKAGLWDGVREDFSSFPLGREICVVNSTQPCLLTHFSVLYGLYILKLQLIGDNSCICFSSPKSFVYAFRPRFYHWAEITTTRKPLAVRGIERSFHTIVFHQNAHFNLLHPHLLTLQHNRIMVTHVRWDPRTRP